MNRQNHILIFSVLLSSLPICAMHRDGQQGEESPGTVKFAPYLNMRNSLRHVEDPEEAKEEKVSPGTQEMRELEELGKMIEDDSLAVGVRAGSRAVSSDEEEGSSEQFFSEGESPDPQEEDQKKVVKIDVVEESLPSAQELDIELVRISPQLQSDFELGGGHDGHEEEEADFSQVRFGEAQEGAGNLEPVDWSEAERLLGEAEPEREDDIPLPPHNDAGSRDAEGHDRAEEGNAAPLPEMQVNAPAGKSTWLWVGNVVGSAKADYLIKEGAYDWSGKNLNANRFNIFKTFVFWAGMAGVAGVLAALGFNLYNQSQGELHDDLEEYEEVLT